MVDMDSSGNISMDTLGTYIIFNHVMFQVSLHILGFNVGSATHHRAPGSQLRVLCPIQLGRNNIFASILQSLFWKSYFAHDLLEYFIHMTWCFRFSFWLKLNILSLGMVSPPTGELNKSCPTFVCRQKPKSVFHWREFSPMYFSLIHVTETLLDWHRHVGDVW